MCRWCLLAFLILVAGMAPPLLAQELRQAIMDQDCAGPGGRDLQAALAAVNSEQTEVLGITVVTGDAWR
jgi:purine nucleosidase